MSIITLDIIRYISKYKKDIENDITILSKMLYLIDWKSCIENQKVLTDIEWEISNSGIIIKNNDPNRLYQMALRRNEPIDLSNNITNIIKFVIEKTERMKYTDFAHLVQSTYPLITSDKYTELNLVELAKEYKIYKKDNL